MIPGTHFEPDPRRAALLDARMHEGLASSLDHLQERIGRTLSVDHQALRRLVDAIRRGGRVAPVAFSDYYQAAIAIFNGDYGQAERHLEWLSKQDCRSAAQSISGLSAAHSRDHAVYFARMTEDAAQTGLLEPTGDATSRFETRLLDGLQLGRTYVPELIGEFETLVRDIVLIAPDPSKSMQIDGGSHYQLWGALFLNTAFHPDDVSIVEVIAHESAHSLLFGFCTDEPLVWNGDDERYKSPLRVDPRPMDGIYHATFVSARMHWAMTRLSNDERLDPQRRAKARAASEADRRNFEDGLAVVRAHADLTTLGSSLMDSACEWMNRSTGSDRHHATLATAG
ncbi:MAG: HEXXH motif-containing putative peptide modification protein [Burkholderiaceae bacterium]